MKISLNWLNQYLALGGIPNDEIQRAITFLGFETRDVISTKLVPLTNIVVGEIKTRNKHPNTDKLSVCTVDFGLAQGGVRTIVCGAPNCNPGSHIPVALPGAVLPGNFKIKQCNIRGQRSHGMMCTSDELGLGNGNAGLLLLDPSTPIGQPISEVLPGGDTVFDIEITPNRPDALSHIGIARELAAWFKKDLQFPEIKFRGELHGSRPDLLSEVRVEVPEDCPRYVGIVVAGVRVGPSPAWMQDRLKAVGLRPINNLVDAGNYVMLELGQPLHVFDTKKISGHKILVRHAGDREKITTLDGKQHTLNSTMLVIADESKPLVIAGITGSINAEVDATTTDIVVEAAYFRPQSIRSTSKELSLGSDASYRFERGIDPHSTLEAAQRAIDLLLAAAGGTVVGPLFKVGNGGLRSREVKIAPNYIRARIGFDIPDIDMRHALEGLNLTIGNETTLSDGSPEWTVDIPSYRTDLSRPIDLVEEVLRIYGTERVPSALEVGSALANGDDSPIVLFNRRITDYLVGQHFHECISYTLRSKMELKTWVSDTAAQRLALANPFVDDQSHLRPTLVLGLVESLKLNKARGNSVVRLCETGRVFIERNGVVQEAVSVGFVICDNSKSRSWLARPATDFYGIKRHMEILAHAAGVELAREAIVTVPSNASRGWQPGQSATTGDLASHSWTACFGLLNLATMSAMGVQSKVWGGSFTILPERLTIAFPRKRYQNFSLYPAALRDLALVIDVDRPAESLRAELDKIARAAAGDFATEAVEIFDVYQGDGLPAGKKSVAFALIFRSATRTLTTEEVNVTFTKIKQTITAGGHVSVR